MIWFTDEGFAQPMRVWWSDYYERWQSPNPAEFKSETECGHRTDIYGEVDAELEQKMHRMIMEAAAPWMPQIPQWLAENPPHHCEFTPDSEVMVYGKLGLGATTKWRPGHGRFPEDTLRYRYSIDGELLDQTEPGEDWWEMFFPGWDEVVEQYDIGNTYFTLEKKGIIEITDDVCERIAVYSYRGEQLPMDIDINAAGPAWPDLYGRDLPVLYDIQQEMNSSQT